MPHVMPSHHRLTCSSVKRHLALSWLRPAAPARGLSVSPLMSTSTSASKAMSKRLEQAECLWLEEAPLKGGMQAV